MLVSGTSSVTGDEGSRLWEENGDRKMEGKMPLGRNRYRLDKNTDIFTSIYQPTNVHK